MARVSHRTGTTLVSMLGIDRRALKVGWTLFLFALALLAIYEIRNTLVIFALALFLAHLLAPAVDLVVRLRHGLSRTVALALVYLVLLGALVSIAIPLGSRIGEQAAGLASRLPAAIQEDPLSKLPLPGWLESVRPRLNQAIRDRMEELEKNVLPMLSRAGEQIVTGIGNVLSVILIPILSFFFLKDGPAMRRAIIAGFDSGSRRLVDEILTDLHQLLAQYIRALVLLACATFISLLGFLTVMGVPYAILLAGTAATLEVIPVVGPAISAVVILLVAAFSGYPHLLGILLFLVVYRVFQDYVLSPYLMSAGVEVPPLLVLFGVIAGEQLGGIPGMFFSVPVIAAARVVLARVRKQRVE
jgi:predicted PurR-regulated permease PerM